MCIILYKPSGVPMPDKSVVKNCWVNNPDGAGLMYRSGKEIIGKKGFMKQKQLLKSILADDFTGLDLVIHFRWATHGLRDQTATHPFPVVTDTKKLTAQNWISSAGIAHNGIISGYGSASLSDTQEFIHLDLGHFGSISDRPEVESYLKSKGGKYVLMTAKKTVMIGDFISDAGCYYSNADYRTDRAWNVRHYSPVKAGKWYEGTEQSGYYWGPINVDICPYSGRIPNGEICSTCQDFDWNAEICRAAYDHKRWE